MALVNDQILPELKTIAEDEAAIFVESNEITELAKIPATGDIPLENATKWLRIRDVICVYVDMKGSTKLSATKYDKTTASIFRLFTSTAIRFFDHFGSPYIDVKGDGVFALFDRDKPHTALAAAVSFRTFCEEVFLPKVESKGVDWLGNHIGIDQKTVLVKRIGLKRIGGRTDRVNEVWAGKPVNMASKLASLATTKQILVSDRFFENLRDQHALKSCGCDESGTFFGGNSDLWSEVDVSDDDNFDFDDAYKLGSIWCKNHGREYCNALTAVDNL